MIIRASRPSELAQVLELWRQSRDWSGNTDDLESLDTLIRHDPNGLLVAVLDGRIVGTLIAVWDGWRGHMHRLTVHPSCRREGIAGRLVAVGEDRLRAAGAKRVSALVWREDDRAARAWRSVGYRYEEGTGRFVKALVD